MPLEAHSEMSDCTDHTEMSDCIDQSEMGDCTDHSEMNDCTDHKVMYRKHHRAATMWDFRPEGFPVIAQMLLKQCLYLKQLSVRNDLQEGLSINEV